MKHISENRRLAASVIYDLLNRIPPGKVSTYGDLAKAAGCPGAARAVGRILNANPYPVVVPCHRVVQSDGTIGGYAFGTQKKRDILLREGVKIVGHKVERFSEIRAVLN